MSSTSQQVHADASTAVVLFGPTQAGKSTTFNWLTDCAPSAGASAVGTGNGESVTSEPAIRRSKVGILLDTPGIDDSRMRFTNQEAGKRISLHLLQAGVKQLKVVVFEGLLNDQIKLRHTLASLVESFGDKILGGVVVLATKVDECTAKRMAERVPNIRAAAAEKGIREVVLWQNEELDEQGMAAQLAKLQEALDRVPPISTADLQDLESRVMLRAKELCARAPAREGSKTETFQQEYVHKWMVTENERVATVRKEKAKMLQEYTAKEKVKETYQGSEKTSWGEWIDPFGGHLFQGTKSVTKTRVVDKDVKKYREVDDPKGREVDKVEWKDVPRQVEKAETRQRPQDVTVTVTIPRELEEFVAEARAQIIAEVRATFKHA